MFTWVETPVVEDHDERTSSTCGGDINYGNYCNRKATALLNRATTDARRCHPHEAAEPGEALIANEVPSIPMFVRPVFTIASKKMKGLRRPRRQRGHPWNANTWTIS